MALCQSRWVDGVFFSKGINTYMSLQKFGLPESLDRIDGAVRWGYNDKTYFFSGTKTRKVRSAEKKSSFDILQELCTGDLMRKFNLWS